MKRRRRRAVLGALVAVAAATGITTVTASGRHGSPDLSRPPAETPGAVDPRVTQGNLATTVCVPGYTATVRPPSSYTNGLKVHQLLSPRYADKDPASYEEDHRVPLAVGGAPTNPA